jgi:hypothetical protein
MSPKVVLHLQCFTCACVCVLAGEGGGAGKRGVYESRGRVVCSQRRAVLITAAVAVLVLLIALIAALARPSSGGGGKDCGDATSSSDTPATTFSDPGDGLATTGEKFPWTDIRLPQHAQPVSYDLFLHPNLTDFQFRGEVAITLRITDAKDFIVFHLKGLNFTIVSITEAGVGGKRVENRRVLQYPHNEQVYVQTRDTLQKGKSYVLSVQFSGELATSLVGFYRSSYTTSDGEKRYRTIIYTNFSYVT